MPKNNNNNQQLDKTELVWPGKRKEVERVELPFQTIETINLPRGVRQDELFGSKTEGWKNRLIWGDNFLVMGSLLKEFAGKINLIYIDPPFAGKVDRERIKPTLPVKSNKTQVLFLGYVINALKPNGRAGIILPEGSLFGTNRDDKDIRRYLLENTKLEAVVSMPAGVFQPYAGVKTSFLVFKKKPSPKLDEKEQIWFFDMKGDGSSLSKAKKFGLQYKNDIPKLIELWNGGEPKIEKPYSWIIPVKDIAENDYILSANTYSPYNGEEEISHRDPKDILREIKTGEKKLESALGEIRKLL